MTAETLLALLIVALYLKDSLLLLKDGEAVLVRSARGRWRAGFGSRHWRLAGREPYLANPFLPHEAVLRLRWQMSGAAPAPYARPVPARPAAVALGAFAWLSWLLLFVAIPVVLIGRGPVLALLAAAGLLYVNIAVSLLVVWRRHEALALDGRSFALLAFECLACAPYAANLVRRLSAREPVQEDFCAAAERLLGPGALAAAKRECLARLDERLEIEAEGGATAVALRAARPRYLTEPDDGRD